MARPPSPDTETSNWRHFGSGLGQLTSQALLSLALFVLVTTLTHCGLCGLPLFPIIFNPNFDIRNSISLASLGPCPPPSLHFYLPAFGVVQFSFVFFSFVLISQFKICSLKCDLSLKQEFTRGRNRRSKIDVAVFKSVRWKRNFLVLHRSLNLTDYF